MNLLQNFDLAAIEYLYLVGLQLAHWRITGRLGFSFMLYVVEHQLHEAGSRTSCYSSMSLLQANEV